MESLKTILFFSLKGHPLGHHGCKLDMIGQHVCQAVTKGSWRSVQMMCEHGDPRRPKRSVHRFSTIENCISQKQMARVYLQWRDGQMMGRWQMAKG